MHDDTDEKSIFSIIVTLILTIIAVILLLQLIVIPLNNKIQLKESIRHSFPFIDREYYYEE